MANMLFKTKGNAVPNGKPRVYFTCHPADFDKYFEKVCEDLFKTHECAVYYTEDMTAPIDQGDLETDLGSNNLFVVPVTFRLLTEPNRAMDTDIPYAMGENIPILPILMEPGLDPIYGREDKFGQMQYLNPFSGDLTEISYEEKLQKYLESILISDEMAKRIRAAFDAYIFLSYRKKDRRYANELMRLIHKNPECRDIAIWYDEFLTPGESFKEGIEKILSDSKLFTLLVTPNLLEEPEGKPNFVMAEEYPAAKKSGIPILPAEMESTDKTLLDEKFENIPECVDTHDDDAFRTRLLASIEKIAITTNNDDPEHTFLMGLAYFEGIDVETHRQRGLELITAAAEKDLPEAMEKLYDMYIDGTGVALNYTQAAYWAERLVAYFRETVGQDHEDTLNAVRQLAYAYDNGGNYKKAAELYQQVYDAYCQSKGKTHEDTLMVLNELATSHIKQGNKAAVSLLDEAYEIACRLDEAEGSANAAVLLSNLAFAHGQLGNPRKALDLKKVAYEMFKKVFGEENIHTISALNNLAYSYGKLGESQEALRLKKQAHSQCETLLGEKHPHTIATLNNLAVAYEETGDVETALKLMKKAHMHGCEVLGEEHPNTLRTLNNIANANSKKGHHQKALSLHMKVLNLREKVLGKEHPDTLRSLNNVASAYCGMGDTKNAEIWLNKAYPLFCKVMKPDHWETVLVLHNLAFVYRDRGDYKQALALYEKVYPLFCKALGPQDPHSKQAKACITSLRMIVH